VVKALCYKDPSGRSIPYGYTQPVTETSTRSRIIIFLGSKAAAGALDRQTNAISEQIVYTMRDP
jgi:hypothetical protein